MTFSFTPGRDQAHAVRARILRLLPCTRCYGGRLGFVQIFKVAPAAPFVFSPLDAARVGAPRWLSRATLRSASVTNSAMLLLLASHVASGTLVSPGWLQRQLASGANQLCILDVTQRLDPADNTVSADADGFAVAHIPGATFVDVGGRLSRQDQRTAEGALLHNMLPTSAQFATELGAAGVSDESHIVLYSSTKVMWATRVWWMPVLTREATECRSHASGRPEEREAMHGPGRAACTAQRGTTGGCSAGILAMMDTTQVDAAQLWVPRPALRAGRWPRGVDRGRWRGGQGGGAGQRGLLRPGQGCSAQPNTVWEHWEQWEQRPPERAARACGRLRRQGATLI